MLRKTGRLLVGLLGLGWGELRAAPAQAQVPALLLGRWEVRQISFVTTQAVPPDLLARMDNPEVAELNQELAAGVASLVVAFRPDGTYSFTITRAGQPDQVESGTYTVKDQTLFAQSAAAGSGSSFDNQRLVQVSRRRLVVEFAVGSDLPGVQEEVEYRRVQ